MTHLILCICKQQVYEVFSVNFLRLGMAERKWSLTKLKRRTQSDQDTTKQKIGSLTPNFILPQRMKLFRLISCLEIKGIWKCLINIMLNFLGFISLTYLCMFVSWVLSHWDGWISCITLFWSVKYAFDGMLSHSVYQLTVEDNLNFEIGYKLHPF